MKKLLAITVSALSLVGCASNGTVSTTQPSTTVTSIVQNPFVLRTTAAITTSTTLNAVKSSDRQKVARLVYTIATGIRQTAESNSIDQTALNELSQKLLTGIPETYRPEVGVLVATLQGLALDRLNQALVAVQAGDLQKAETYRQLVVAVAEGVQDASLPLAGGTPSTVVGAAAEDFGKIKVPALKWN